MALQNYEYDGDVFYPDTSVGSQPQKEDGDFVLAQSVYGNDLIMTKNLLTLMSKKEWEQI